MKNIIFISTALLLMLLMTILNADARNCKNMLGSNIVVKVNKCVVKP